MGKLIFFSFFPFFFTACLYAQPGVIRFNLMGGTDGLESGFNYFLHRDSRGLLWASSVNGVYCSDGLTMRSFTTQDGLLDNIVQSPFFEDTKGNIWFSTYTGLNQYLRSSGGFRNLQAVPEGLDTLKEDYYLIFLEQEERLWFRAGKHLCRYDLRTGKLSILGTTSGVRFGVEVADNGKLRRIYACPWMNGGGFELFSVGENGGVDKQEYFKEHLSGKYCEFLHVLVEADTLAWLFCNQGLMAFNPKRPDRSSPLYSLADNKSKLFRKGIFWEDNQLMALTATDGPVCFDKKKRAFIEKEKQAVSFGLQGKNYQELMLDGEQFAWFAHEEEPHIEYGNLCQAAFVVPDIGEIPILSIIERHDGEVWCAAQKEGVFVFDQQGRLLRKIPYRASNGTKFNLRSGLVADAQNGVWATNGVSLFWMEGNANRWKEVHVEIGNILRLGVAGRNRLYLSTDQGVFTVEKTGGKFSVVPSKLFKGLERFDGILTFFGQYGYIYTYANGKIMVQKEGTAAQQQMDAAAPPNLMLEDSIGQQTWFGTTKGVLRWAWGSKRMTEVGQVALRHGMAVALAKDASGKLWVGGFDGIQSFDPDSNDCHHYRIEDGLPAATLSMAANLTATNGYIWMGTAKGAVFFDPEKVGPFPYGPPVLIASFEVNNLPYRGDTLAAEATRIELKHFQNNLSFGLKAVGFYLPKLSKIYYRLNGYDNEWREVENGGLMRYPKLPSGEYNLELYAVNANGVRGRRHVLNICILPPWWHTWWFWLLVSLALLGLGFLSFKYYLRRKLMEQQRIFERQKALQDERNRIASELHDDMGAGLSIIRFLSDDSLHKAQSSEDRQSILRIYHSAGELLEKMGDIIWAMNAENDNLYNLAAYLQGYAYEYLDTNQLQCSFDLPQDIPSFELSGAQRRNVVLAVKESLHNVVKHAKATAVNISLATEQGQIAITIHDNGQGIDLDHLRAGGNGVRNIKKRMEAVGGIARFWVENGTVVQLSLPIGI